MDTDKSRGKLSNLILFTKLAEIERDKVISSIKNRYLGTYNSSWTIKDEGNVEYLTGRWDDVVQFLETNWDPNVFEAAWTGNPLIKTPLITEIKINHV